MITSIALAAALLAAPAAAQQPTLTDIVAKSGGTFDSNPKDHDILFTAVTTAGLEGALADPNVDWTLFAPNDRAFMRLAKDLGYQGRDEAGTWTFLVGALTQLGGGDPIPVLTDILLYHVAPQPLNALQVIFSGSITTLQGGSFDVFFIFLIDNDPDIKNPRVSFPLNVKASNGIFHTINRVLIPLDI